MTSEKRDFRPFEPRRLVPLGPRVPSPGGGTVFPVGTLAEEEGPGRVLQLAGRKR